MWALDQLYVPRSERFFAATPRVMLAALAIGAGTARLLVELAVLPPQAAGVAGVTAGHGALLATALAWTGVGGAAQVLAVALIGLAAAASHLGALGACAYAGPALWVAFLSARGRITGLGLGTSASLSRRTCSSRPRGRSAFTCAPTTRPTCWSPSRTTSAPTCSPPSVSSAARCSLEPSGDGRSPPRRPWRRSRTCCATW